MHADVLSAAGRSVKLIAHVARHAAGLHGLSEAPSLVHACLGAAAALCAVWVVCVCVSLADGPHLFYAAALGLSDWTVASSGPFSKCSSRCSMQALLDGVLVAEWLCAVHLRVLLGWCEEVGRCGLKFTQLV